MSNPVIDCLVNHRSIRKFKDRPIEPEVLESILHAGTRAATGGNMQLYSFLVVDSPEKKAEIDAAIDIPFLRAANCPALIIALADTYRVRCWLTAHSEREVATGEPLSFLLAVWDALIALQNVVVAAESLNLGTCYVGSILHLDAQKILGVPEYVFPIGMVHVGYPDQERELSMRLPLEAVTHRNTYHIPTAEEINDWYRERDAVWDKVADARKEKLAKENIFGIAQALAVQKFAPEEVKKRSRGIIDNLKKAGFDLS